jgi:hypothetical protein
MPKDPIRRPGGFESSLTFNFNKCNMAKSINKVILVGNVGKDPEITSLLVLQNAALTLIDTHPKPRKNLSMPELGRKMTVTFRSDLHR